MPRKNIRIFMYMKKSFSGVYVDSNTSEWKEKTKETPHLNHKFITSADGDMRVKSVLGHDYLCCYYRAMVNVFTFSKFKLKMPFRVIAPAASVDKSGFLGNLKALVNDFKKKSGITLLLNLSKQDANMLNGMAAVGKTLPTMIFSNRFTSFEQYISSLRSSYRRRIKMAISKGQSLTVRRISPEEFNEEIYALYKNVLKRSDFPLETLPISFFKNAEIDLFEADNPAAFVMTSTSGNTLEFVMGGMDYSYRDRYDTYYNMLLHVIKLGIEGRYDSVNLGQTAELTKGRLGALPEERYMAAFSRSKLLTNALIKFSSILENNNKYENMRVFKDN